VPVINGAVRARCAAFAFLCAASLFVWQSLTVHFSYAGNWTGLFCTGARYFAPPAELQSEHIYVSPNTFGYDGQAYHYIAHDPFLRRGFARSVDAPRLRYRRILVPGLAWLLAGGDDQRIDVAYICVVLGFVLLGAYWTGRYAALLGYPPGLGLSFALVPAVLISIDRLTVDVALAACCVGFALYTREWRPVKLYPVLVAAALSRETGSLLIAACVIWLLFERRFRDALLFATAAIPAACWYVFVQLHTAPVSVHLLTLLLFSGIVGRIIHPLALPTSPSIRILADVLDLLALGGIATALLWAFRRALRRVLTPLSIAIYAFALLTSVLAPGDTWSDVYSFGRTLTPLLLLCALDGLAERRTWPVIAMLAVDPRIGLSMGRQMLTILRGLASLL
jgi:hypothetical protein